MAWYVYILECADRSFYTGITNDLEKRLKKHAAGTGAKYTRGRGPCVLRHVEKKRAKGAALKREMAIKALTRTEKINLISPPAPASKPQRRRAVSDRGA